MTCARRPAEARRPAPSTSAGSRRPDAGAGRSRARFSLLAALALLLGALSLFAAPVQAQTSVWSATLNTKDLGTNGWGCWSDVSQEIVDRCSTAGTLTDDDFTHDGTTLTFGLINFLTGASGATGLRIAFDKEIPVNLRRRLTLHVGGQQFSFARGRYYLSNSWVYWDNVTPAFVDQTLQLSLTVGPPQLWTGVFFQSFRRNNFVPSSDTMEQSNDLIVPERGSSSFGVQLSEKPTENVTVNLWKYAHEAIHGNVNAVEVSPTTLTFTPDNYSALQYVYVDGVPDNDDRHEHLYIMASVSTADPVFRLSAFNGVFVTVSDDGGAVQVGAWPNAGRESGDGTATNASMTVWLSRSSTAPVSVSYATVPDTEAPANQRATAGSDYTAVSGTVTFAPGETRKTVQVPILDDNVEDSGETFRFELSNPQGASLEPNYSWVPVEIRNDEAHLDGLSVEGASGADGPWTKLDLGAFAAETTAYAVTVPHGTTHARLVPTTSDEDLQLWTDAGTGLSRARSGAAGPAVALAVGDNVLMVRTLAGTGVEKTYRVTVTRQARPAVAVSLSATPNPVGEGSPVTVRATLAKALSQAVTVPLRTTRGTSEDGDHGSLASITIPAGSTSATGTVSTVEDGDGDDETFTVALGSLPSGLTAGSASSVRVTITDSALTARLRGTVQEHDGETPFMVELALSESLDSGSRWPSAASFAVKGGSVESVRRFRPYLYQVHVRPKSWKDVTVTLAGGRACSEEGAICTADGRSVSNSSTMTVGGPVRIRIEGARAKEGKDASLDFAVTLNRAAAHTVSVDYATEDDTATAGADYTAMSGTLVFAAGETAKTVKVPVLDDAVDEGKETMRLLLSNPQGAYLRDIHRRARGIIRNDDALQKLWLSRFGRMVATQTVAALEGRFATPSGAPSHATVAGVDLLRVPAYAGTGRAGGGAALSETLTGLAQAFGAPSAPAPQDDAFAQNGRSGLWNGPGSGEPVPAQAGRAGSVASAPARGMTARALLAGSSFRFTTGGALDPGGAMTGWGKVVSGGSDGSSLAGLSYTSETATGILGMDWERNRLLVGVALSRSLETGRAVEASGTRYDIKGELSTVAPYMRVRAGERLSFWSALGSGEGSMALSWGGVSQKADIAMQLVAAGGRAELLRPEAGRGFALALKGDAFFVRTESARVSAPGVGNLAASAGDASRVRAVLEGSRSFGLAGGGSLEPSLSLGLRHDGGDAETGTGVEAGAGLSWSDPVRGLTSDLRLYGLAAHESGGYEEWGASGSLRMVPDPSGRGLSLSMTPSWGAQGQTGRLWSEAPKALTGTGGGEQPGGRLDTEVGYGLAALGGTGTPYAGLGLGDGGARDWRLGWRFTSERLQSLSLGVEAIRREAANASEAEHGVTVRGALRW